MLEDSAEQKQIQEGSGLSSASGAASGVGKALGILQTIFYRWGNGGSELDRDFELGFWSQGFVYSTNIYKMVILFQQYSKENWNQR